MQRLIYFILLVVFGMASVSQSLADPKKQGVLYWQKNNNAIEMRVYLPERSTSLLVAKFSDRPSHLFFTKNWKTVFYVSGMHLYRMPWKTGAKPVHYLTFPKEWKKIESNNIWRDKVSKKWRFAYGDNDLDKYPVVTKGTAKYLKYKNSLVIINNRYYPLGSKNIKYALEIINVLEYDKKSGWRTIAKVSTTCNAPSDPCFWVLNTLRHPGVISAESLKELMYDLDKSKLSMDKANSDSYGLYKTNLNNGSLISMDISETGDSISFMPPLILIQNNPKKGIVLIPRATGGTKAYDFLGVQQYKHYLLASQSVRSNRGRLFNLVTGKLIFTTPEESPVIWVQSP